MSKTLSSLAAYGKTNIHTKAKAASSSPVLNTLMFERSIDGIHLSPALPKQAQGQINISGGKKVLSTPSAVSSAETARVEYQSTAPAQQKSAAYQAAAAAIQARTAAAHKAAQEKAVMAQQAAIAAAQAKSAAAHKAAQVQAATAHKTAQEKAAAAHKTAVAAAQAKSAAAHKAAQEKAAAAHKTAVAAAQAKSAAAHKAAQEKAAAAHKAAQEKAAAAHKAAQEKTAAAHKAAQEKAAAAHQAAVAAAQARAEAAHKAAAEKRATAVNTGADEEKNTSSDNKNTAPAKHPDTHSNAADSKDTGKNTLTNGHGETPKDHAAKDTAEHNIKDADIQPISAEPPAETDRNTAHDTEGRPAASGNYKIYESAKYGSYIKVNDFGADPTGQKDSLAAIKSALEAAHKEKAMLFMDGKYYISDQIVLDDSNSGVKGIFGSGMGQTQIKFDKAQIGIFNPDTNHDDVRSFAGILVDGQNGKTIAELSVQYTRDDFYRKGLSYFGKVNGILVNDADNTLISKVEVSGANRAGITFTSTAALMKEAGYKLSYKSRVASGAIDDKYETLPLGENNRIVDSNLHHNRVAGALVSYQKNFIGEGNLLSWNGHQDDGGTGYGMAVAAGSYNYGITYRNNTTNHNYRKGLDVHDGTNILIENNTLNGDRLYGIAVYNRQFSMSNVKISGNTINQDASFRLDIDDDLGSRYHMYSGIQIQTNTQRKDLHSPDKGYFDISNNTINNLDVYKDNIQTYGIEFRNHEQKMDYTLNISGNSISGESTKYLMAVINDTYDFRTQQKGIGTGTINISDNTADIGKISKGAVPFYIEEHNSDVPMHGSVTLNNNNVTVREESGGYTEFAFMQTNAKAYHITNNTLSLHGHLNDGIVDVRSTGDGKTNADLNIANNTLVTDIRGDLYKSWLRYESDIDVYADANTHNGSKISSINTTGSNISLNDLLSEVGENINALQDAVYSHQHQTLPLTEEYPNLGGIL